MDIVERGEEKCGVGSEGGGYWVGDNGRVEVCVGREGGFGENEVLEDVERSEKGNGKMGNRERNVV